jgi:hypothetical protein
MKKIYIVIAILIVACTGFNIYNKSGETAKQSSDIKVLKDELSFFKKNAFFSFYDNGQLLNDSLRIYDENRAYTTREFVNMFLKSNKLFFRYTDVNCNACVDSSLIKIKAFSEKLRDSNVIILASYQTARDLYVWKRINKITNPVFRISYKSLAIKTENLNEPFFFVLNKYDRTVQNLFIPAKEYMHTTDEYLQSMLTKIAPNH